MKKFWKKDKPQGEMESKEIPASTLYRWFLYDSQVPNPNTLAAALGYTPISEELEEMEMRDSHKRLAKVLPYRAFIELCASMNGRALVAGMAELLKESGLLPTEHELSEKDLEMMEMLYTKISFTALVPAFSAALALGILESPGEIAIVAKHE